uniref:WD_REPEATS_REGION domain-containing protein n=1 Tax=Strongyloides venezuelensis TaxID=75913 RepID=A0A0K0FYI5_STRVS
MCILHNFRNIYLNNYSTMDNEIRIGEVHCVTFNQDLKSLLVGHERGYSIYNISTVDKLGKISECTNPEYKEVIHFERLFSSNLITFVHRNKPRHLIVYNFAKNIEVCKQPCVNSVVAVRLNRYRIIICLEETIHIHNVRDMKKIQTINDTPRNPNGIIDLSNNEPSFVAYPGDAHSGIVNIYDGNNCNSAIIIHAHDSPLAALKFNNEGTMIATSSTKGTVIRIWDVASGEKLFEFSRGVSRCVTIYSLAFSPCSGYLAASSNTETVHIFKLIPQNEGKQNDDDQNLGTWVGYIQKQFSPYLPTQVSEVMSRSKSYATATLPRSGFKNVVCMPVINKLSHLLVATTGGYLYCYHIPPEGGECSLLHQYIIGPTANVAQNSNNDSGITSVAQTNSSNSVQKSGKVADNEGEKKLSIIGGGEKQEEFPPLG